MNVSFLDTYEYLRNLDSDNYDCTVTIKLKQSILCLEIDHKYSKNSSVLTERF